MDVDDDMLENIAGLIYDTDPYIYPAMFGTRENALELIPELIKNGDSMFSLEHLFVAEYEEDIAGIILWIKGKLAWSKELFKEIAWDCGIVPSPHLDLVTEQYLNSYNTVEDEQMISLINVCVTEEVRNIGIGTQMMEQFLKNHRNEPMNLCVLEENPEALRLYQKSGFKEVSRYPGFSVDNRELVCIGMKKSL